MNKFIQLICLISLFAGTAQAMELNQAYWNAQLIYAARNGGFFDVVALIEDGAHINTQDTHGNTPLMLAARRGKESMSEYLIENNADVNARNIVGNTALMLAVNNCSFNTCAHLIAKKANVNAQDADGNTPLMLVAGKAAQDMYDEDLCDCLIRNKADVNAKNKFGTTALIFAAAYGRIAMCKYFTSNGADMNARDNNGCTALIRAGQNGHTRTCIYLIDVMLHPIKQDLAAATALLGIKRFRNTSDLAPIDINIVKIIARQAFEVRKQDLFRQIHAITSEETKQTLLDYVKRKLQAHSEGNARSFAPNCMIQ